MKNKIYAWKRSTARNLQAYNKSNGKLEVVTTKDQDPVLAPHVPIIGIDIWEHAYVFLLSFG
jgi:superoxide dismutase